MKTKNKYWTLLWSVSAFFAVSCGELTDQTGDGSEFVAESMRLSRHEAYLMVGDQLQLTAEVLPENVRLGSILWNVDDNGCLEQKSYGVVVGRAAGDSYLHALLESNLLEDRCLIHVLPRWMDLDYDERRYDMVVYARNEINGQPLSDSQVLAAKVADEVRGVAQVREFQHATGTISYLVICIYSDVEEGETVSFWLYDRADFSLRQSSYQVVFDGEQHGTLSDLVQITLE